MATETIITREAPDIEARRIALLDLAKQFAGTPIDLPDKTLAELTPDQLAALSQMRQGTPGLVGDLAYGKGSNILASQGIDALVDQLGLDRQAIQNILPGLQPQLDQASQAQIAAGQRAQETTQSSSDALRGMQQDFADKSGIITDRAGADAQRTAEQIAAGTQKARDISDFAQTSAKQGIETLQGAMGEYDPSDVSRFMNPYKQEVIDRALADVQRASDVAGAGRRARAIQAGAFGGSREAIVEAEEARNTRERQADIAAKLRSQGFDTSQQAAQTAFENQQRRQMQGGQLTGALGAQGANVGLGAEKLAQAGELGALGGMFKSDQLAGQLLGQEGQLGLRGQTAAGQLGLGEAKLGAQIGSDVGNRALREGQLGFTGTGQLLSGGEIAGGMRTDQANIADQYFDQVAGGQAVRGIDTARLLDAGNIGQRQDQLGRDLAYENTMAQTYEPYRRLGFYSDILTGTPTSNMQISQTADKNPSLTSQLVGGIGAGANLYNAYSGNNRGGGGIV